MSKTPLNRSFALNTRPHRPKKESVSLLQTSHYQKHRRYLSVWQDDVVVINDAFHQAMEISERQIDLRKIQIGAYGGLSYFEGIIPLSRFPHLTEAVKHIINRACEVHDKGDVGEMVSLAINDCVRIFVWMMRQGKYQLSQLTKQDTNELINKLSLDGWWSLLNYEDSLSRLVSTAKRDRAMMEAIIGTANTKELTINTSALSNAIGLPIPFSGVPLSFVENVGIYSDKVMKLRKAKPVLQPTTASVLRAKKILNWLARLPNNVDRIAFQPFPRTKGARAKTVKEENTLFIDDAVKILKESLKWIYDYAPGVLKLCQIARKSLESQIKKGYKWISIQADVERHYAEVEKEYGIPIELLRVDLRRTQLVNRLVEMLQTAALCVIAFNHGRRRGEISDEKKRYGLYFGCVRDEGAVNGLKRIDIYIEKSVQQYVDFWCNKLVADAVSMLENIAQCFRKLFSPLKVPNKDITKARKD